jgi:uncharacterized membrane protein YccC
VAKEPVSEGLAVERKTTGWLATVVRTWRQRLSDRRLMVPAVQRGIRAAVIVPISFAFGQATGNSQIALFSAFGAFALLLMVEVTGRQQARLRAFVVMVLVGAFLVVVGTASSQVTAAAVPVTAVLVFAVLFSAVLSPLSAQATTATLLFLMLSVAVPVDVDQIPARLAGVAIAAALSIPAAMLIWPPRGQGRLRLRLAETADAMADLTAAGRAGLSRQEEQAQLERAVQSLLEIFDAGNVLPAGVVPSDQVLCKLVGHLRWTVAQVRRAAVYFGHDPTPSPEADEFLRADSQALRTGAAVLRELGTKGVARAETVARLREQSQHLQEMRRRGVYLGMRHLIGLGSEPAGGAGASGPAGAVAAASGRRDALAEIPGDEGDLDRDEEWLHRTLDPAFRARALTCAVTTVLDDICVAAERGTLSWRQRLEGFLRAAWARLSFYADPDSAWLRNSIRGGLALALAVLVVDLTDVQHGFWVALGVLSVLRSSAVNTGRTGVRAVAGTVAGVIIASLLLWIVGAHTVVLWILLPIAVLVAAVAPVIGSFIAGQAAFTLVVVILFNIIQPTGWSVGLVRIQDVAIGCGVALLVGLLFWPRGAARLLGVNLCRAYATSADYLQAGIQRIMNPDRVVDISSTEIASREAGRVLDDAFRDYLVDRGAKEVRTTDLVTLMAGAVEVRQAADSIANLPRLSMSGETFDLGHHPSVRLAGDELRLACDDVRRWYLGVREALGGHRTDIPPQPRHPELLGALATALDDVRSTRASGAALVMMRLLWACEDLEDLRRLEPIVARARGLWSTGRPVPLWTPIRA